MKLWRVQKVHAHSTIEVRAPSGLRDTDGRDSEIAETSASVIFQRRSIISQIRMKPSLISCDLGQFVRTYAQTNRGTSYQNRSVEQIDYCRSRPCRDHLDRQIIAVDKEPINLRIRKVILRKHHRTFI
jgi:hypothetical protein